jgi:prepilin-type N-terminal cleavage/methylation domain-containing protein
MHSQKGFTIIELIVVIAIIAVLAAIVLVNVSSYVKRSRQVAALANARQMTTLALDYFVNAGNSSYAGLCGDSQSMSKQQSIYNSLHGFDLSVETDCYDSSLYTVCKTANGGCTSASSGGFFCRDKSWLYVIHSTIPYFGLICVDSSGHVLANAMSANTYNTCVCQ